jgi:hypothetical protein
MCKSIKILLLALVVFTFTGPLAAQKIKTIDGVRVTANGKNPSPQKGVPTKIRLVEDFAIGGGDDPSTSFASVSSFVVDEEGTIYALDFQDVKIKIFDNKGDFLKLFGEKGQGPGEFDTPAGIHLSPNNELVIEDALARQLLFFTPEGKFLRNLSMASQLGAVNVLMDPEGNFLAREMGFQGNLMFFEFKKYDREFKPLFTLDKIEAPLPIPGSGIKLNVMDMMAIYQLDGKGNILYGRNLDYEIKILSPEGKHFRSIRREFEPVKITEEDIDKMLKMIPNLTSSNIKDMLEFPKYFPPFQFFTLDEEGRLFVRTWDKAKKEDEFVVDVFDAEGRYIHKFESSVDIRLWKDGKMFGMVENEEGFRLIKRYTVFWE